MWRFEGEILMMSMKAALLCATLFAAGAAHAATVTQQDGNIFNGQSGLLGSINVTFYNSSTESTSDTMSGAAGAFQLKSAIDVDGDGIVGDGSVGGFERFIAFCVTPFTYLSRSGTTLNGDYAVYQNISSGIKAISLQQLEQLGALAKGAWDLVDDSVVNAVAFQLAAWEIVAETSPVHNVYEADTDADKLFFLKSPSPDAKAAALIANDWLSKLGTTGFELSTDGLTLLTVAARDGRDVTQDLITYIRPVDPPAPVPLPGALGLLAVALAAFGALGRASARLTSQRGPVRRMRTRLSLPAMAIC
jgi:hypothetical protein